MKISSEIYLQTEKKLMMNAQSKRRKSREGVSGYGKSLVRFFPTYERNPTTTNKDLPMLFDIITV